jgi:S1-C subfamily serine protease
MNLDEYEKAESKHYEWDELRFSKEDLLEAFKASRTVKNYKGECNSGIGTIIIINEEGWFITAYHVIAQIQQLSQSNKEYKELLSKKEEIEKNVSLKSHVKNQQI